MASISSYYTFYLIHKFGLSVQNAQLHLFAFLFAVAAGTVIGGPVGDKIGRKYVIWGLYPRRGAPLPLFLPYASLEWTGILTVIIGFILASAFFRYPGLCPGAVAGENRYGFRPVLWFRVWHGRPWRRGVGVVSRPYQHRSGFIKSVLSCRFSAF